MPVNTKEGSHEPAACPEEPIRDSFKDISHAVGAVGFLLESPKKARALFVNGLVTVWDIPLSANDRVSFPFLPEETDLVPEEGPLTILYEDEVLLAVHKEQGLLVHNSGLTQESSLSRRVLFYYREHGIKAALHPVSRLDRETSGIVLFAKNAALHHMLTKAPMKKLYLALSHGPWENSPGSSLSP